jgi:hypothetical protein
MVIKVHAAGTSAKEISGHLISIGITYTCAVCLLRRYMQNVSGVSQRNASVVEGDLKVVIFNSKPIINPTGGENRHDEHPSQ